MEHILYFGFSEPPVYCIVLKGLGISINDAIVDGMSVEPDLEEGKVRTKKRRRPEVWSQAKILKKDDWRCHYCGRKLNPDTVTADHVIPKSKGGTNWIGNVVASCRKCNGLKDDMDEDEFKLYLLGIAEHYLRLKIR